MQKAIEMPENKQRIIAAALNMLPEGMRKQFDGDRLWNELTPSQKLSIFKRLLGGK